MSRDLTPAESCAQLAGLPPWARLPADQAETLATATHSPLPGTGSIPIPLDAPFTATSYTSASSATTDQRSVAVASFDGDRTVLRLYDWWYGQRTPSTDRPGAAEYAFPEGGAAAPEASLTVQIEHGRVLLIRCAALTKPEKTRALHGLAQ